MMDGGGYREERGCHGGDAGAQAVHVIEDAESGGDSDDPKDGETAVEDRAWLSGNKYREKLSVDSGRQEETRSGRHANEELHLVMQHAAVVEQADGRQKRRTGENARDLLLRRAAKGENHGDNESKINRDAAEKRDRLYVDFSRAWPIDHTVVESQTANRNGETQRSQKRYREGDQIGIGRHGLVAVVPIGKRRSSFTFRAT